jgi:hypothetical protein
MNIGDRIRAMTDDEIAVFFNNVTERCCRIQCGGCVFYSENSEGCRCNLNVDWIKDWLKLDNSKIGNIDLTNLAEVEK